MKLTAADIEAHQRKFPQATLREVGRAATVKAATIDDKLIAFLDKRNTRHETTPIAQSAGKITKLERTSGNESLEKNQGEKGTAGRVLIRFTSTRKRLCDPDNLSEKWMLDALRYCRIIQGDEPDKITLETSQRKCEKGEQEHTLIELYQVD